MTTSSPNISEHSPGRIEQSHSNVTAAVLIAMAVVIFIENAVVCLLYATNRKLRTTTNIFVVSLAISDLFVGVLFVPVYLATVIGHPVNLYVVTFLLFTSLFNLCGVTYDRYHAILQPLTYVTVFTYRRILTILALIWLLPLVFIAVPFTWGHREPQFVAQIGRAYLGLMVSIVFLTCVFVSKVYYSIFKAIKRQMKMTRHMKTMFAHSNSTSFNSIDINNCPVSPGSPQLPKSHDVKRDTLVDLLHGTTFIKQLKKQRFKKYSEKVFSDIRAAKLFAAITIIVVIFWLPVVFINFMVVIDRVQYVPLFIFDLSIYAFVANALVDPLLFTFYNRDYRCALLDLAGFKRNNFNLSVEMLDITNV